MPQHWHVAKMILLSKTKSKIIPVEDTQPISLLSCLLKAYEQMRPNTFPAMDS